MAPLRGAMGKDVTSIMGYPAFCSFAASLVYPILAPLPNGRFGKPLRGFDFTSLSDAILALVTNAPFGRHVCGFDFTSLSDAILALVANAPFGNPPTGAARSGRQTLSLFHEDTTINERSLMVCPVVLISLHSLMPSWRSNQQKKFTIVQNISYLDNINP